MSRFAKYKWSFVAVAILLLLAVFRSQFASKKTDLNRQPAIHHILSPDFASIPAPVPAQDAASNPDFQMHQLEPEREAEPYLQELEDQSQQRIALTPDGGEFVTDQTEAYNLDSDLSEPEASEIVLSPMEEVEVSLPLPEPKRAVTEPVSPKPLSELQKSNLSATESNTTAQLNHTLHSSNVNSGRADLPRGVLVKVVNHIEYGKSLARRGATFGARQEFVAALKLVAQSKRPDAS